MPRRNTPIKKRRNKPPQPFRNWMLKNRRKKQQNPLSTLTHEEQRLEFTKHQFVDRTLLRIKEQAQGEDQQDYTLQDITKSKEDAFHQSQIITQLLNKNKIGISNAFQINILSTEGIIESQKTKKQDIWKKCASILHTGNLVYGFKVDAFLNEAYKLVGELSRSKTYSADTTKLLSVHNTSESNKEIQSCAKQFLQKKIQTINVTDLDQAFSTNPFFEKAKREFNECSLKSLLVNNLSIGKDISLSLFEKNSSIRPMRKLTEVKIQAVEMSRHEGSLNVGLKAIIKNFTDETNEMCRDIIGPSHRSEYQELDLDINRVQQAPPLRRQVINPGHAEWSDTRSNHSYRTQFTYHNPLGWDNQIKIEQKQQPAYILNTLNNIGTGQYLSNWPLKQQYNPASKLDFDFNPRLRLRRWELNKIAPTYSREQNSFREEATDKHFILVTIPEINFSKFHCKQDDPYKSKLRNKLRKHYNDHDDDRSRAEHQPIRVLQERVRRLKTIESAPVMQGERILQIEKCYKEYRKDSNISVQKFFMTFLHMANHNGACKIVSSEEQ